MTNKETEVMETEQKEVSITMRFPADLYKALTKYATFTNTTNNGLVRSHLADIALFIDDNRLQCVQDISKAIRASIRDTSAYGGAIITGKETSVADWNGSAVAKHDGIFYHQLWKFVGQNLDEVVQSYATRLVVASSSAIDTNTGGLKNWAEECRQVCDPSLHRFVLGRVNFERWRTFENIEELSQWRREYDTGTKPEPATTEEWAIYGWCKQNLPALYKTTRNTIHDGADIDGVMVLQYYRDWTLDENIEVWARKAVQDHRENGASPERLEYYHWTFEDMKIERKRARRSHQKNI
jgi:hypothetical protein